MNIPQIKNFASQSRNVLKSGVLNRILALGFDVNGTLMVDRPVKIQGGTIFMGKLREDGFYDAWSSLEERITRHSVKEICEEAAYTWFNRLVAIRIMQKNGFIEPVLQYTNEDARIPIIVDQARSGRLSLRMAAAEKEKLDDLLKDPNNTNEQFNLLISAYCNANPVIYNCFGGIEKYIGLLLPDNILAQDGFIDMLNNKAYLTDEDYAQSELIGWLYQYYISERKDEVFEGFKKGRKAEAEDIPAATQIFTPNWIVKYMVENTVGRIYLDNNPNADNIKANMKYLVEPAESTPESAILRIDDLTKYKMIDNACGSGHILIESFNLFYRLYLSEGYAPRLAIENILLKNIIGIDLDTRAKQLATFALLMTAAKLQPSFLDCKVMPRVLDFPDPFVYRGGLMKEFLSHYFLGGNQKIIDETEKALELMKQANNLGSIMRFDISPDTRAAIERSTSEWEKHVLVNPDIRDVIPSMKIILALTDKYVASVTNPPYMGAGNMNPALLQYASTHYPEGKADLMTVFMLKCESITLPLGRFGMITLPSWLFLSSFEGIRNRLINKNHIDSLLHMGRGIFGIDWGSTAFCIQKTKYNSDSSFFRLHRRNFQHIYYYHIGQLFCVANKNHHIRFDFGSYREVDVTETFEYSFINSPSGDQVYYSINQDLLNKLPGKTFGYWLPNRTFALFESGDTIGSNSYAVTKGIFTGDNKRFLRLWTEVAFTKINSEWRKYTKSGGSLRWFGLESYVLFWGKNGNELLSFEGSGCGASKYFGNSHIVWSGLSSNAISFRYDDDDVWFDDVSPSIVFNTQTEDYKLFLLAFGNSKVCNYLLKVINPTFHYQAGDIKKLPFVSVNPSIKERIDKAAWSNVVLSRSDWDAHETSWDFKKNELIRAQNLCGQNCSDMDMLEEHEILELKDTVPTDSRLISHCIWAYKNDWTRKFEQLHSNEEELNRQFIEIYGLQDELTPDVPKDEITILQQGEISIKDDCIVWHDDVIVKQFISYAIGCWMGRYRLDKEGLNIAHYPADEEICTYEYKGHQFEIDDDAIIPMMGTNNPFEDDNALQKLINFVKIVFGEGTMTENLNYIEHCLGKSLENYLIKDFWKDHKKMYQNRPIYWLFSSQKGAFQVLTYMHRMNPYTVEKIRTKYLLPYIDYLKGRIEVDEARGVELSSVERQNLAKMKVALDECNEYHDRLHEVAIKAIGFDLDDGVVVNYAKFGDVLAKIK